MVGHLAHDTGALEASPPLRPGFPASLIGADIMGSNGVR